MIKELILILISLAILELLIKTFSFKIRKIFQWNIIRLIDDYPFFDKKLISKFKKNTYDQHLGWDNKKNTSREEKVKSIGEISKNFKKSIYSFDKIGARKNTTYRKKNLFISTYGDSFVFCKHVNDNQTWQNELSYLTKSNVVNFGVNNYGVDQALLKYKKKKIKSKIVIIGFVPETIIRIHSSWKHFSEYGNILGFKPRYFYKNNKIFLKKNFLKNPNNLTNEKKKRQIINLIKKHDFWYKNKFLKDEIKFPYFFYFFKNFKRNIYIYILFLFFFTTKKSYFYNLAWKRVLKDNFKLIISTYFLKEKRKLLIEILKKFIKEVKKNNAVPVIVCFPYKHDLDYIKKNNKKYYLNILEEITKISTCIDLSDNLLTKDYQKYYNSDFFGSHLNGLGNKVCAKIIYENIKNI